MEITNGTPVQTEANNANTNDKESPHSLQNYWFPNPDEKVKVGKSFPISLSFVLKIAVLAFLAHYVFKNYSSFFHFSSLIISGVFFVFYIIYRKKSTFLVDFTVFSPKGELAKELICSQKRFIETTRERKFFTDELIDFQERVLARSGLGDETYFPRGVYANPREMSLLSSREEAEMVFTQCIDDLFAKTQIKPKDIDILIVSCSLFNPTPSISSMIVNKYKFRKDVKSFNLSGMGCSAGLIAVDLAKDLLSHCHFGANALVFCHENITQNWYCGTTKGMIIPNVLFRMGGACLLLSNKLTMASKAKYKLSHLVRVHIGSDDDAYKSIYQMEDSEGMVGVKLGRNLFSCVSKALEINLTWLGVKVLPFSEQALFIVNYLKRKLSKQKTTERYVPNFRKAFDHFCIHSGGRAVIDGIQENLHLSDEDCKPSRAALFRYGNTSSASIWYVLFYIERAGRLKQGDKIFQMTFGSGVKVQTAVWETL